jgi:peptide/nickel transport system permease protein
LGGIIFFYFIRKLLYSVPVILGVTLITFFLFNIVGGDPALQYAGKNASAELISSLRQELGLNQSLWGQYLFFLKQTLTFQWGQSWTTQQSILKMFGEGIGPSLSVTLPAFLISVISSVILSLFCAFYRYRFFDKAVHVLCLSLMSVSFLVYIIVLQKFLTYDHSLFPVYGWDPSWQWRWQYVGLPWLIYVAVSIGPKILVFRAAILDEVQKDYVRTGRAKGLSAVALYGKHILRNALIPILTLVLAQMPSLITGSLLLETFFGIPGIGNMLVKAIQTSDFPVIKAMTVMGALFYIAFNLLNDLLYFYFEPRVRFK